MSYGWREFDPTIVQGIADQHPEHLVKHPQGGMTCPLISHKGEWLSWQSGNYAKGTAPHGSPEMTFRVSPTYILSDPLDNFRFGRDLIGEAMSGSWGKAETHRLGSENSEDALTFNVFRALQVARQLGIVAQMATGTPPKQEPELFLWGRHINPNGSTDEWADLARVRKQVEPAHRQQTEPDACLYVHGWGWVFIEAKFAHGIKTSPNPESMERWLRLYPDFASTIFNLEEIAEVLPKNFPEQVLRNMVFAYLIRGDDEEAAVISLGREKDPTPIAQWLDRCVDSDCPVGFSVNSWEEILSSTPGGRCRSRRSTKLLREQELLAAPRFRSLASFEPVQAAVQRFDCKERRRSRTYPATGCAASPVLKVCAGGFAARRTRLFRRFR